MSTWLTLAGLLVLVLFVVLPILALVTVLSGAFGRDRGGRNPDEARMIQEVYHGLERMEQRVEALETLLLERERAHERAGDREGGS